MASLNDYLIIRDFQMTNNNEQCHHWSYIGLFPKNKMKCLLVFINIHVLSIKWLES
jgi:hypothetical protein